MDELPQVFQTTLISMFPISYALIKSNMIPETPSVTSPLSPEDVYTLLKPNVLFDFSYTGTVSTINLNTELTYISRCLCNNGQIFVTSITFDNLMLDEVTSSIVINNIVTGGDITVQGISTSIGILQISNCIIGGSLTIGDDAIINSFELFSSQVNGQKIKLPSSKSLVSIFVFGNYSQLPSLSTMMNRSVYPHISTLLWFNAFDRAQSVEVDIPSGFRGFGCYGLVLKKNSYPDIVTLGSSNPWDSTVFPNGIETIFPNLLSNYVVDYFTETNDTLLTVPENPKSKYNSFHLIGSRKTKQLDLTKRGTFLSGTIRIMSCPELISVALSKDDKTPQACKELILENCGILYIRGVISRFLSRPPDVFRFGDQKMPGISGTVHSQTKVVSTRLLDMILLSVPNIVPSIPATASDFLPNVITFITKSNSRYAPNPIMQTVRYEFTGPVKDNSGDPGSSNVVQYNGGTNPIIPHPSGPFFLKLIEVTGIPYNIKYIFSITQESSLGTVRRLGTTSTETSTQNEESSEPLKGNISILKSLNTWLIIGGIMLLMIIVITSIILSVRLASKRQNLPQKAKLSR